MFQTPVFILRRTNYGERHVIVDLLGKDRGRISAIAYNARGSKRRFGGALQPLRILEASLKKPASGDLYGLDALDVIQDFPGVEDRLETLTAGGYATELIRETSLAAEDTLPIFELLKSFLTHLPRCPGNRAISRLVYQFEYQLLDFYGLAPMIQGCARCGLPHDAHPKLIFSRSGEGLICPACRHSGDAVGTITPATLALLHHLADPDLPLPGKSLDAALAQTGRVLSNAIDLVVERPLPAREMLRDLL